MTCQIRVASKVYPQLKLVVVLMATGTNPLSQLSMTMGTVKPQPCMQETVSCWPQLIKGPSASTTVTSWVQVAVTPLLATAVQMTGVLPRGKEAGASLVRMMGAQATGAPRVTLVFSQRPGLLETTRLAGQAMSGARLVMAIGMLVLEQVLVLLRTVKMAW